MTSSEANRPGEAAATAGVHDPYAAFRLGHFRLFAASYVLATIGYAGGLPFGEIGAKMMVTVSNLTGIVDRLEEKKLVLRERDENDRRVVHVVLTDKGAKLYKSTIPLFEKSVSEVFAPLGSAQQKELSALLRKLNPEPTTK